MAKREKVTEEQLFEIRKKIVGGHLKEIAKSAKYCLEMLEKINKDISKKP